MVMPGMEMDFESIRSALAEGTLDIMDLKRCVWNTIRIILQSGRYEDCLLYTSTGEIDRSLVYPYRPGIPDDRFFLVDFSDLQPSAYHIASLFCVFITSYPNCGFCQDFF